MRSAFERLDAPKPSGAIADPETLPRAAAAAVERLALVHRAGAAQSELRIGHVALPRRTPDYHAALVANMVLGGQFVSRINMNLREDKGYTYGARTAFEFRRAPGPVRAARQRAVRRDRRRAARGDRRDSRHPRRAPGHPRTSWSSDARR